MQALQAILTVCLLIAGAYYAYLNPDLITLLVQHPERLAYGAGGIVILLLAASRRRRRHRGRRIARPVPFAPRIFRSKGKVALTAGTVYVLENRSMPGLVKIGSTKRDIDTRGKELSNTSTATPFTVAWSRECRAAHQVEQQVHRLLEQHRVSRRREFFRVPVPRAVAEIERAILHIEQIANEHRITGEL